MQEKSMRDKIAEFSGTVNLDEPTCWLCVEYWLDHSSNRKTISWMQPVGQSFVQPMVEILRTCACEGLTVNEPDSQNEFFLAPFSRILRIFSTTGSLITNYTPAYLIGYDYQEAVNGFKHSSLTLKLRASLTDNKDIDRG